MMQQEKRTPYYAGNAFANPDYADGQLPHVIGASSYQVMRANRAHPEWADGAGNTYNHAPMLTWWRGKFYLEYLSNPVNEHSDGGCSFLCISEDGVNWSAPRLVFPVIKAPAGVYDCADGTKVMIPEDRACVMHQRMGFYRAPNGRLLVSGFYGHVDHPYMCPWVNYGIGRVVREIFEDGSLGPIYMIRILTYAGWTEQTSPFPHYRKSRDQGFVEACDSLLKDRLVTQQWAEEHGEQDEYVHIKASQVQVENGGMSNAPEKQSSFCWYHTDENTVMALWKNGVVGRSDDGGDTWQIVKEFSFATTGAKAWGQKTPDGRYMIAYVNSIASEQRYPLCAVTGEDGVRFDQLAVLCGEVPPRRYEGLFKDYGPQYVRGICEGYGERPGDAVYLSHSMNKEDMWVTRAPMPIRSVPVCHAEDDFTFDGPYMEGWNVYSPLWAPVRKAVLPDGTHCMRMADRDPVDYARAERCFPSASKIWCQMDVRTGGLYGEALYLELTDERGAVAVRVLIDRENALTLQTTTLVMGTGKVLPAAAWARIRIEADCDRCLFTMYLNDEKLGVYRMRQKCNEIGRLVLRTKPPRRAPGVDVRPDVSDLMHSDEPLHEERVYWITRVRTGEIA